MSINISQTIDMSGRTAVVTGGGTGVGLYIAKGLASNGARVYITGRRADVLEKAASAYQGSGALIPLPMDVTDEASIKKGVEIFAQKEGKLDILINNAGISSPYDSGFVAKKSDYFGKSKLPYELESFEGWQTIFKLNTFAPFFVTTAFMDLLIKGAEARKDTASVINISSVAAGMRAQIVTNSFAYGTTKAALNQITTSMASDLARKKIPVRINAIEPGGIPTDIIDPKLWEEYLEKPFPGMTDTVPLGRPEEIALTAIYFAAVGYSNGAILRIDGGTSLVNV